MQAVPLERLFCLFIFMVLRLGSGRTEAAFHFNESALAARLHGLECLCLELRSLADADNSVADYLLRQMLSPRQLSVNAKSPATGCRHRALVLHSEDLAELLPLRIRRGGVLILIFVDEPSTALLRQFAHHLWEERGVQDVYYMSPKWGVFYNPFAVNTGDEALKFGQFVSMDVAGIESVFDNLNGYALRTYIFNSVYSSAKLDTDKKHVLSVRGADAKAAKLLAERLNFTLELQLPDEQYFGARLDNGSFNGALGRVIRYETDAVFTGFFVKDYMTRDVEFSVSVYMDELCCYVRKAERVPQSILPLFAVNLDVWSSFLGVGLFCPLIWMGIRSVNLRLQLPSLQFDWLPLRLQCMRIFIDTWVVWVRVNITRFPPFMSERVFVLSLCLVSVIFGALFESSLATVYIRPLYYRDINTLRELEESQFRIYIKHAAMKDDLFYGHSSTVYQNLDERVVLVAELEDRLINMMSKRGGFAAVTRASSLVLDDIYYFITQKIHQVPECPKNYHIAFVLPKHSPYEERFNGLLLTFIQAGLIRQWVDEMKHRAKISIHRFRDYVAAELGDVWKVLTLGDLQLAFYALLFGSALAVVAFLAEHAFSRHRRRSNIMTKLHFPTQEE